MRFGRLAIAAAPRTFFAGALRTLRMPADFRMRADAGFDGPCRSFLRRAAGCLPVSDDFFFFRKLMSPDMQKPEVSFKRLWPRPPGCCEPQAGENARRILAGQPAFSMQSAARHFREPGNAPRTRYIARRTHSLMSNFALVSFSACSQSPRALPGLLPRER